MMYHHSVPQQSRSTQALFALLTAFAVLVALACAVWLPAQAYALDTVKTTAKTNSDSGAEIMGNKETRVTWEGQAAEGERLTQITLTFPKGTTFGISDARVTLLKDGGSERVAILKNAQFNADDQTIVASFDASAYEGDYYRFEVYDVMFPAAGGEQQITGTYTANGAVRDLTNIPVINVTEMTIPEQIAEAIEAAPWYKTWCDNKFLKLFLNPALIVRSIPVVFNGFLMALGIVLCAFPCAIPLGLLLALMRMSKLAILRGLGSLYVNIVRGTPLFLQIYVAFFGLPLAGINIPNFPLGVIVLFMNSAAYLCEIFRAGIQSIPKGQNEASRSLGMNAAQTMIFVIIPQTVRRVIPTMTSEFILLYKDTSLLAAVGIMEVVQYSKSIVASTGSITPYIVAALFYLVITLPLAKFVGNLEAKLAGTDGGSATNSRKKHFGKKTAVPALEAAGDASVAGEAAAAFATTAEPDGVAVAAAAANNSAAQGEAVAIAADDAAASASSSGGMASAAMGESSANKGGAQ